MGRPGGEATGPGAHPPPEGWTPKRNVLDPFSRSRSFPFPLPCRRVIFASRKNLRKGIVMATTHTDASEVSILNRILRPDAPTFSPETARDILALDFDQSDKERMQELSAK